MKNSKQSRNEDVQLHNAKRLLVGGRGVIRDDSDDELGFEDYPWEYIYGEDGVEIIGACMGNFKCLLGDTVLLKAEGTKEAWVGLLCQFGDIQGDDHNGTEIISEKAAHFMWFSTEKEIRNKVKKRSDCLPHELYITPSWDWNPLTTINGKAKILSYSEFEKRFPSLKIPRTSRDFGKTFLCRRGCNTRTATYTEYFEWTDAYGGPDDIHSLVALIKSGTWSSRKRKKSVALDNDFGSREADVYESSMLGDASPPKKRSSALSTPSRRGNDDRTKTKTPRHKSMVVKKPLEYSPIATRILLPQHVSSPFHKARSQLHVSTVPKSLPCREEAFATVYAHLEAAITEGSGSCIYISGTPGTGKTATVREIVKSLDTAVSNEELDDFIFVEINGMKITEPQQAYVQLWQALRGETVSSAHALNLLEQEFNFPNPRRIPCVVLMDELDQLVTKSQSVMYNFFNWPGLRHSRLIVLAVANTMDLPERTLSNKISSRLGLVRIPFAGYTHNDLMRIIQSRLEGIAKDIMDPDAIQFASRKVAAVSGDARRALDICRRAVEIAEAENLDVSQDIDVFSKDTEGNTISQRAQKARRVTIATIKKAISEATSSPLQQAIKSLSIVAKLVLAAINMYSKRTGLAETGLVEVLEQARRISSASSEVWIRGLLFSYGDTMSEAGGKQIGFGPMLPRPSGLGFAMEELVELGVITMEARRGDRVGRVRLNVNIEDVQMALKDDKYVGKLGFYT